MLADHVSCTIEMNINRAYDVAVIDEIQMIGSQRATPGQGPSSGE